MRSLKAFVVAVVLLPLPYLAVGWSRAQMSAFEHSHAAVPLHWRALFVATTSYLRWMPFALILGPALAALVGGLTSKGTTVEQERMLLLLWLILSVGVMLAWLALALAAWTVPQFRAVTSSAFPFLPLIELEFTAPIASVVVAVHLLSRVHARLESRIRPWHVALGSALLLLLGPALLIPPAWVWVRTANAATEAGMAEP